MSAFAYYKSIGYQQVSPKQQEIITAGSKINIWSPTTSMRIAVTNLVVSSGPGGTIQLWFGGNNQIKLVELYLGASTSFGPVISNWESTATDAPLFGVVSSAISGGWRITAEGFELE